MLLLDFLLPPPRPRRNANPPRARPPAGRRVPAGRSGGCRGRAGDAEPRALFFPPSPSPRRPHPAAQLPSDTQAPTHVHGGRGRPRCCAKGLRGDAPTLPCHRSSADSPGPPHGGGVAVGGPEPTAETRARLGLCSTIRLWCPWGSPQPPQYADREVISGGQAAGAFCAECSCVACHNQAFLRRGKEKFPKRF